MVVLGLPGLGGFRRWLFAPRFGSGLSRLRNRLRQLFLTFLEDDLALELDFLGTPPDVSGHRLGLGTGFTKNVLTFALQIDALLPNLIASLGPRLWGQDERNRRPYQPTDQETSKEGTDVTTVIVAHYLSPPQEDCSYEHPQRFLAAISPFASALRPIFLRPEKAAYLLFLLLSVPAQATDFLHDASHPGQIARPLNHG
jgi:hypothetical protein